MSSAGSYRYVGAAWTLVFALLGVTDAAISIDFSGYARNATIHEDLDLHWTVNRDTETVRVAIHAKGATGWAGFGISEMGGMEGADIVFFEAATGNITDTYSLDVGSPEVDECGQDWTLLSAEVDAADGLVFEAERLLSTGDPHDRAFVDDTVNGGDPTKLIAAWGNEDTVSYHGIDNVAQGQEYLFADVGDSGVAPLAEIMSDDTVSYFDVTAVNFTIPKIRTFYKDSCVTASEFPGGGEFHAIGFDAVVQESTESHIHHLVLKGYYDSTDCGGPCDDETYSPGSKSADSQTSSECDGVSFADIYVWAPGVPAMATPDGVGFRFGTGAGAFQSIGIQTHYDNPNGVEGEEDNSGVRVYYTEELRPIDAGVIELGDPFIALYGQALEDGKSRYSFTCPSSCFETYFEQDSVTVFGHGLHMHQVGQHMITRQYRDDELVYTSAVEYYAFAQAGLFMDATNTSVTIQKGDRFETDCYYDTAFADESGIEATNGSVVWGLGSENEMCISYLWYYPLQPLPFSGGCGQEACGGSLDEIVPLEDGSDLDRTFGILDKTCEEYGEETGDAETSSSTMDTVPSPRALASAVLASTFTSAVIYVFAG